MMDRPFQDTTVQNMNSLQNKAGVKLTAPDAPSHTSPGAEGWKDVLQLMN